MEAAVQELNVRMKEVEARLALLTENVELLFGEVEGGATSQKMAEEIARLMKQQMAEDEVEIVNKHARDLNSRVDVMTGQCKQALATLLAERAKIADEMKEHAKDAYAKLEAASKEREQALSKLFHERSRVVQQQMEEARLVLHKHMEDMENMHREMHAIAKESQLDVQNVLDTNAKAIAKNTDEKILAASKQQRQEMATLWQKCERMAHKVVTRMQDTILQEILEIKDDLKGDIAVTQHEYSALVNYVTEEADATQQAMAGIQKEVADVQNEIAHYVMQMKNAMLVESSVSFYRLQQAKGAIGDNLAALREEVECLAGWWPVNNGYDSAGS